jgi:hypothetical protein
MSRTTKLLTLSTALLAPWLLTSAVVDAQDTDLFGSPTFRAAVTISNLEGVTAKPLASFDISFVEPAIGLYALGDRTNNAVDLVDTQSNTFLGFCGHGQFTGATGNNNTSGPDGVLIRDNREIWVGDGDSTVKVFDVAGCSETTMPKHTIPTGDAATDKRADEMCYDPVDQLILVANNAADPPFASLISTIFYAVVQKIPFPQSTNGIEQCQWNPRTGLFYITVPGIETPDNGHGQVAVIDPAALAVTTTFDLPVEKCDTPQGMAIGPDSDILIGCNKGRSTTRSSVIIGDDGTIRATVANESGPDMVWFNPGNNHYFLARSNAGPPATPGSCPTGRQSLGIIDAGTRVRDTGINNFAPVNAANPPECRHPSAHSVAADSVTGFTFFPIPADNATTSFSNLCGSVGGDNTMGCILVVTGFNDGDDTATDPATTTAKKGGKGKNCFAQGAPVIEVTGGQAKHLRRSCD